jgi:hypothetical protein
MHGVRIVGSSVDHAPVWHRKVVGWHWMRVISYLDNRASKNPTAFISRAIFSGE